MTECLYGIYDSIIVSALAIVFIFFFTDLTVKQKHIAKTIEYFSLVLQKQKTFF